MPCNAARQQGAGSKCHHDLNMFSSTWQVAQFGIDDSVLELSDLAKW